MHDRERQWEIREFREGDQEGILELSKAVYPEKQYDREQWMRWWQWMYEDNPSGKGVVWIAEHDSKIVGQYPLVAIQMKVRSEVVKVGMNIDLMVHPDYRRQGMFAALEDRALEEMGRQGVNVVVGFPNEIAYPGHLKSEWFDVGVMQAMIKPLNWRNSLRLLVDNGLLLEVGSVVGNLTSKVLYKGRRTPVVEGLSITQVDSFDERVDDFWAKVSHRYPIAVVGSREHLNWRYSNAPDMDYLIYVAERKGKLSGYLVLRGLDMGQTRAAVIFALLAQSGEVAQCLIAKAVEQCRQERVDLVYYASIGGGYEGDFSRNGFMSLPFVKRLRFCAYSRLSAIGTELLRNSSSWFVQMGDSDMM